ncbi:MAG: Methicillin resistance mecR1 protein [Planctomycetes bacterium ADurb.Bin412]|nr:MAG: Methicillin resistance mecR1 protein [Planctomycetes bacterium ADurb.Bin412]
MYESLNSLISGLNQTGTWFGPYAFAMLIQSSILIVLLLGLDLLLRKHTRAVFRYCMWLLVLVKLILPPGLTSPASIGYWAGDLWAVETQNREPAAAADPVVSEEDFATLDSGGLAAAPEETIAAPESALLPAIAETAAPPAEDEARVAIGWQGLVMLGWLFGLFVFGALLLQRVWFVKGLLRQAQEADGRLGEILKGGCDKLGLRGDRIKVKISATMVSPAVCGLIRPTILLPGYLAEKFNPSQLQAVMLHELAHIKRGDLWVNLIQTILQIGYFYHPLLWVANRMIRRVREQAVDEMVLVALEKNATDYSHTLIDIAEMAFCKASPGLGLIGVVESRKALAQRIKHIISRPIPRTARLGVVGLVAVLVTAAVLLPMARAEKEEATDTAATGLKAPESNENQFSATLPNGAIVTLIGVCENPNEGKQWWQPDGSLLKTVPYNGINVSVPIVPDRRNLNLAVLIENTIENDGVGFRIGIPQSQGFGIGQARKDGKTVPNLQGVLFDLPMENKTADVHVGVAAGQWFTKETRKPDFNGTISTQTMIWNGPITQDNKTVLHVAHMETDLETRIIAMDKSGNIHTGGSTSGGKDEFVSAQIIFRLPLSEIAEFQFQTRPYQWLTFQNISLQPGQKTDVQVETDEFKTGAQENNTTPVNSLASKLEFRVAVEKKDFEADPARFSKYLQKLSESGSAAWPEDLQDFVWLPAHKGADLDSLLSGEYQGQTYYLLHNTPDSVMPAHGWGLKSVYATSDALERPAIGFEMDANGIPQFEKLTAANLKRPLAIIINGEVYSAPTIMSQIHGIGQITGVFSLEEVGKLVSELKVSMPPTASSSKTEIVFGPVMERIVNDYNEKEDQFINLDTSESITVPDELNKLNPSEQLKWIADRGIDACGHMKGDMRALTGFDLVLNPVKNSKWDSEDTVKLHEEIMWHLARPGLVKSMDGRGPLPITCEFRTREGSIGILQIIGFTENPQGVKIRYKMLQNKSADQSVAQVAMEKSAEAPKLMKKYAPAEDKLSARELLEQYAANQKRAFTSFIHKCETREDRDIHCTEQHIGISDRFVTDTQYYEHELRTDGSRANYIFSYWGQVGDDIVLSRDNRQYVSWLWDGDKTYLFDYTGNISDFARAFTKPDKSSKGYPHQRNFLGHIGASFWGYLVGDTERFDEVLLNAKNISVREEREEVRGVLNYVIDAINERGSYTIWIDPEHGYNFSKAVVQRQPGDKIYGESKVNPGEAYLAVVENMSFQEIDGVWIPSEATRRDYRKYANYGDYIDNTASLKVLSMEINPDHEALGSFFHDDTRKTTIKMTLAARTL